MQQTGHYRRAQRQVERKFGFLVHLAVYLTVNTGLILTNLVTLPERPWAAAPLLGWGVGLLFHALAVFLHAPAARWKERMIAAEMKKVRRNE